MGDKRAVYGEAVFGGGQTGGGRRGLLNSFKGKFLDGRERRGILKGKKTHSKNRTKRSLKYKEVPDSIV